MVAYSVKKQFEEPIRAGIKPHTMRNDRARHARPGEEVQIYYAMRTKNCRLIGRATCQAVSPVRIDFCKETVEIEGRRPIRGPRALNAFAVSDGFANWWELKEFWRVEHGVRIDRGVKMLPPAWSGVLIEWTNFKGEPR